MTAVKPAFQIRLERLTTASRALRPRLHRPLRPPWSLPTLGPTGSFAQRPLAQRIGSSVPLTCLRHNSSVPVRTTRDNTSRQQPARGDPKREQPAYDMTFTCKVCTHRSTHRISKQGYTKGTVLVQCPGCQNRHLIADHLKIFSDEGITLEDILKEKGQLVKRGTLGADGDVEFWDDGTETPHN